MQLRFGKIHDTCNNQPEQTPKKFFRKKFQSQTKLNMLVWSSWNNSIQQDNVINMAISVQGEVN